MGKKNLKQIRTPSILCYHNWGEGQEEVEDNLQTAEGTCTIWGVMFSEEMKFKLWVEVLSGSWREEEESVKVREEETFIHIFIEHLLGARTFSPEHPERYKSVLLEFRMFKAWGREGASRVGG